MAAENAPPKIRAEDKSDNDQDPEKGIDFVTLGMFIIGECFLHLPAPLVFRFTWGMPLHHPA
jgi:hypothetical protein